MREKMINKSSKTPSFTAGIAVETLIWKTPVYGRSRCDGFSLRSMAQAQTARSPVNGTHRTNQLADPVLKHGANIASRQHP